MILHHPDDALLLAYVTGSLDSAAALVVSAHVEMCPVCRRAAATLEAAGGVLLESIEPIALEAGAFSRTMARIDAAREAPAEATQRPPRNRPDLPEGVAWPRSLRNCEISPWKTIGPGMRWSRIQVPGNPGANAFLLRMAAGRELAMHTHDGRELTLVLHGAFRDERAEWHLGDLDETDRSISHRPIVNAEGECICLVAVQGRVRFQGWIARALGAWMGI
ncbi:MAG TPA: ChrR family anti-sigma-E factor [Burkholderiaceae bacterium]|nr:ChrR family anti-sigma-E factor [Burkholderiaceae bacterium]